MDETQRGNEGGSRGQWMKHKDETQRGNEGLQGAMDETQKGARGGNG